MSVRPFSRLLLLQSKNSSALASVVLASHLPFSSRSVLVLIRLSLVAYHTRRRLQSRSASALESVVLASLLPSPSSSRNVLVLEQNSPLVYRTGFTLGSLDRLV